MPTKPGIRTKPRSARKAKAELRVVQSVKRDPAPADNWLQRILAIVMRKVLGRG